MFCARCGAAMAEGARFCRRCGAPAPPRPNAPLPVAVRPVPMPAALVARVAAAPAPVLARERRTSGNALTWPFRQDQRPASLWIAGLAAFLPAWVICFGWWLDAAGRRGRGDARLLPENRDLLHMLRDGLIVAFMSGIYFFIPLLIISLVFHWGWDEALWRLATWGAQWIQYWWVTLGGAPVASPDNFGRFLNHEYHLWWQHQIAPIAYLVAAIPMFVTALARFALTRKAGSFFHLLGNAALSLGHLPSVVAFVFLVLLWALAGVLALSLFAWTGIGVPILFVPVSAAELWISARLGGNLAARIWQSKFLAESRRESARRAAAAG